VYRYAGLTAAGIAAVAVGFSLFRDGFNGWLGALLCSIMPGCA
jgi:hypothetical protein